MRGLEDKLDLWLVVGRGAVPARSRVEEALLTLAQHEKSRECLLLLESILETPGLMPRLTEVLRRRRTGNREQGTSGHKQDRGTQLRRHENEDCGNDTFYLVCFLAGLMLSFVSLLGGMGHFGGHVHAPHCHLPHAGHVAHCRMADFSFCRCGAGAGAAGPEVPWWNAFSIMIFLCWFGAAGYLLTQYGSFVAGRGSGAGCDLRRLRAERSSSCF